MVLVALGDSTTAGTPYSRSPYIDRVNELHRDWKALARGVNGERSNEILARFERDVLTEKPRYVAILAGVNDIWQGVPEKEIRENISAMYDRAKKAGIVPIAASVLPVTAAGADKREQITSLNAWIRQEAKRRKIPFCDLAKAAADPKDAGRLRGTPDGLHPDEATYRLMGEALARLVADLENGRRTRKASSSSTRQL